jgi:hypothetical protein
MVYSSKQGNCTGNQHNKERKNMKTKAIYLVLILSLVLALPVLALAGAPTAKGVQPVEYPGNFVSSDDDQVCYDMSALGYIGEVTGEMRGFKIDPPVNYNDGFISTTISADGRYLDWVATGGAKVLAFIIKGGPSYNLYDYVPFNYSDDQLLHSPVTVNKKGTEQIPQISHYNVCYEVGGSTEGCTPGYWRNHADRWVGVSPTDDFDTTFGVDLFDPDVTLGWAIWANGGGNNAFARHATAALLNAYGGVPNGDGTTVAYPYTAAEVIQMVQDAVADGTIEATKDLFEDANELGCPLSGTSAVPVVP